MKLFALLLILVSASAFSKTESYIYGQFDPAEEGLTFTTEDLHGYGMSVFREGSELHYFCASGTAKGLKEIAMALVAADNDGGQYADFISSKVKNGFLVVEARHEGEDGVRFETFRIPLCSIPGR
jgi:hypothetical protein